MSNSRAARGRHARKPRFLLLALLGGLIFSLPGQAQTAAQQAAFRALVDRQMLAWKKADFSIAAGDWAADGVLTSPGGHFKKSDLQGVMTDYFKHFKDLNVVLKRIILSSDATEAAIEWEWNVTRIRDGAKGSSADCIVVVLKDNKIKSWREYFDLGDSIEAKP
jgi:ketosteroid isomerase-like protein